MKWLSILLLLPLACFGQQIPGCGTFTPHAVYNLTGASNVDIHDVIINAAGGAYGIRLTNCNNVHIHHVKIINQAAVLPVYSGAIDIHNSTNVYIDTSYVANSAYGVLVQGTSATNLRIVYNRFYNIHTDSTTNGDGSAVQLNGVTGSGIRIDSNYIWQPHPNLGVGDQISIFQSNGVSGDPIRVMYNQILGGSTNTTGKAGYVLGDVGGSWQYGRGNLMVNPGTSGALVQGGTNIQITGDQYFSDGTNSTSIVGLSFGNFSGMTCNNITMDSCKINWKRSNGNILNKFYFTSHGEVQPTGWLTNTADGVGDPTITAALLPNPLWAACLTPPVITYTSPHVYNLGQTITLTPTNTGGTATSWTCSPTLPVSLSINSGTGVITGTLTATVAMATYTVTATNSAGSGTFPLVITVVSTGAGHLFFTSNGKLVTRF